MKLIAYQRVSTGDKKQDPERQRATLESGAARDGNEIVAWVVDEGTKAGENAMPTFDRPKIKEAFALARQHGAEGLIVENVDRWTRKGADDLGYSHFVLRRDYGLRLWFADLAGLDGFALEVLPPLMATLARLDNKRRSDQQRTSAALRKSRGERLGRPPRPALTDEEFEACCQLYLAGGGRVGVREMTLKVRELRGAHLVADPKGARRLRVSPSWMADELWRRRPETLRLLGRVWKPWHKVPPQIAAIPGQPEEVPA